MFNQAQDAICSARDTDMPPVSPPGLLKRYLSLPPPPSQNGYQDPSMADKSMSHSSWAKQEEQSLDGMPHRGVSTSNLWLDDPDRNGPLIPLSDPRIWAIPPSPSVPQTPCSSPSLGMNISTAPASLSIETLQLLESFNSQPRLPREFAFPESSSCPQPSFSLSDLLATSPFRASRPYLRRSTNQERSQSLPDPSLDPVAEKRLKNTVAARARRAKQRSELEEMRRKFEDQQLVLEELKCRLREKETLLTYLQNESRTRKGLPFTLK